MTEEVLKNFVKKREIIDELQKMIQAAYDTRHTPIPTISKRSTKDISGPVIKALDIIDQLQTELDRILNDWLDDAEEIEAWLLTIPDLNIVSIIRWHFLLGYNWRETSIKIFNVNSYCFARAKYLRYVEVNHIFEEQEKTDNAVVQYEHGKDE